VTGLAIALEDREIGLVELLTGLVDRMQGDERILEFGRRLANDRLAITVDAVDIVAANILRCVAGPTQGRRAFINPVFDLTCAAVRFVIKAFGPQIGAGPIALEVAAVAGGSACGR
jgi:hypothetical protein